MPPYSRVLSRRPWKPKFQLRDWTSILPRAPWVPGRALSTSLLSGSPLCHSEGTLLCCSIPYHPNVRESPVAWLSLPHSSEAALATVPSVRVNKHKICDVDLLRLESWPCHVCALGCWARCHHLESEGTICKERQNNTLVQGRGPLAGLPGFEPQPTIYQLCELGQDRQSYLTMKTCLM